MDSAGHHGIRDRSSPEISRLLGQPDVLVRKMRDDFTQPLYGHRGEDRIGFVVIFHRPRRRIGQFCLAGKDAGDVCEV